jgi:hypothetical protein
MKICGAVITSTDISKPFSKNKYVIIHYVVPLFEQLIQNQMEK